MLRRSITASSGSRAVGPSKTIESLLWKNGRLAKPLIHIAKYCSARQIRRWRHSPRRVMFEEATKRLEPIAHFCSLAESNFDFVVSDPQRFIENKSATIIKDEGALQNVHHRPEEVDPIATMVLLLRADHEHDSLATYHHQKASTHQTFDLVGKEVRHHWLAVGDLIILEHPCLWQIISRRDRVVYLPFYLYAIPRYELSKPRYLH